MLVHSNLQLRSDLDCRCVLKPVFLVAVLMRILDCKLHRDLSITLLTCCCVDGGAIEVCCKLSVVIIPLIVSHSTTLL